MKKAYRIGFYLWELGIKLGVILLIFSLLRLAFYIHNQAFFPIGNWCDGLKVLVAGWRFDLPAICYINIGLIASYLLPLPQRSNRQYRFFQHLLFVTCNGLALMPELTDIAYFPFNLRRANANDFNLLGNNAHLIPLFFKEYWYLVLLFLVLMWGLWWSFRKWGLSYPPPKQHWSGQWLVMALGIVLTLIGMRGGTQLRPLMPLNAQQYVFDKRLAPLLYPSTLSLIFSTQQRLLDEKHYFEEGVVDEVFPVVHPGFSASAKSINPNIVVIVLESFGQEYSGFFNKNEDYMVFLDSLIQESYHFERSYANGLRSIQGIAAISASIPALMEDPFSYSAYQTNQIDGIAHLLTKKGYTCGFFHGANPGSMGMEDLANLCGFDYYYDRRHYDNDAHYDGYWGIWDRPFFQFTAKVLDTLPQPFFAQLLSLSSHHPYRVEPYYEQLHPRSMPLYRSIRYTDQALRQFFKTASKMDWFDNTLFIITADHTGYSRIHHYQTRVGRYQIPLILYHPGHSLEGRQNGLAQQIDIFPTILDYIGYDQPFVSFGRSLLDTASQQYAYMYHDQVYQILDDRFILLFDEDKTIGLYDYTADWKLMDNVVAKYPDDAARLERRLKAVLQQHHNRMIRNELGAGFVD